MTHRRIDPPGYRPIDCGLHDRLEAAATLRRPSELEYVDETGRSIASRETIVDVFARNGEEFLRTSSGLELRLDRLVSLDGVAFGVSCEPRIVLETERLTVRELVPADAEFVLALTNEPSFLRFIGDRGVRTPDDARAYIGAAIGSYRRYGYGLFLVHLKDEAIPIGMCGILHRDWLEDPDLGYAFLPSYWRRGYALEAAKAVLAHAGGAWSLDRIVAVVAPANAPSIRLLEKLGMRFERTVVDPNAEQLALFATEEGTS